MVRILGERIKQLTMGAKPLVKNFTGLSYEKIAEEEFKLNMIPFKIIRTLPNGNQEMWTLDELYKKALNFEYLTKEEGMFLFEQAPLNELSYIANELRKKQVPHGKVTWQIDRNVNTTNVCIANCKFCNFFWDSRFKK